MANPVPQTSASPTKPVALALVAKLKQVYKSFKKVAPSLIATTYLQYKDLRQRPSLDLHIESTFQNLYDLVNYADDTQPDADAIIRQVLLNEFDCIFRGLLSCLPLEPCDFKKVRAHVGTHLRGEDHGTIALFYFWEEILRLKQEKAGMEEKLLEATRKLTEGRKEQDEVQSAHSMEADMESHPELNFREPLFPYGRY